MDTNKGKQTFEALVKSHIQRPGIDALMRMLEESDFYRAPASTRFHGAEEGGLCQHSITVGKHLFELANLYAKDMYTKETLAIVALFHDVCKIGCYKTEMRNVKNEMGQWEKVPFFKFEEDFSYGGHGSKSVFLIMQHMVLTAEEATAINCHMGFADTQNNTAISNAYDKSLLAWMLHVADEAATFISKM